MVRRRVTSGEVAAALAKAGASDAKLDVSLGKARRSLHRIHDGAVHAARHRRQSGRRAEFRGIQEQAAERRPGDLRRLQWALRFPRHQISSGVRGPALRSSARRSGRADLRLRPGRLPIPQPVRRGHPGDAGCCAVRAAGQFGLRSREAVAAGTPGQWRRRGAGDGRVRARLQGPGPAGAHQGRRYDQRTPRSTRRGRPNRSRGQQGQRFSDRPGSEPPVPAWVEAWQRQPRQCCDPCRAPVGAHADLHLPGDAGALSPCPPAGAQRISADRAGLARLDRRRAALDRQCHELRHGAVQSFRYRLLPRRAADGHRRRSTRWSRWC